jgi:hypothetical protein
MPDNQELERKSIQFNFSPYYQPDSKTNTVEKADKTGNKRMYIEGVASGPKLDQHAERMTDRAIESFQRQAVGLLLYPDVHGIKASEDIGIVTSSNILPDGDWHIVCRLWDEHDDVDQASRERARKEFNQLAGNPPYPFPKQKGFSIEGYIPPEGIISAEKDEQGNVSRRVIDDVLLDGVILCPRPAYKASVASAVYKTLGEMNPFKSDKVRKAVQSELTTALNDKELTDQYFRRKWDINDALDKTIDGIMKKPDQDKEQQLEIVFDEFKQIMIDLLMKSESLFKDDQDEQTNNIDTPKPVGVTKRGDSQIEYYRAVLKSLVSLKKSLGNYKEKQNG